MPVPSESRWQRQFELAEGRRLFNHACFATRLGGVSGGKETQGWRDSSHTAMVGAGKFGRRCLPHWAKAKLQSLRATGIS